ncbi:hypothetical protein GJ631_05535 [Natronomonas sp. CBA1123]|uniref:hypothetical protein n=1 Tax=Natronomonas sp. CBA1123 TaxID=2668070 RepID=UPI0012EAB854|nr:hypothetical protein [Natronomonas sp. CBA1123]MUV86049.1 hypothetical protein [Natronomonas sp. CBA1123]
MSTKTPKKRLLAARERGWERLHWARETAFRVPFGDRIGWTLFLGALVFYGLYWRVDVFIIDTFAIVNALVSVADGSLAIQTVAFGPDHGATPGVYVSEGALYGRNYGQIVLSLPALVVLEAVSAVADLRIALTGLWCVAVAGVTRSLGSFLARERLATLLGSSVAALLFVAGVLSARQLPTGVEPLLALQFTTMVAAALCAVVVYRLLTRFHDRRIGTAAGVSTLGLATVAFWAPIPKRHAFVALFALVTVYCFARAREGPVTSERWWRAVSYASVGVLAWVSAPDALVLLVALGPLDLLFARQNRPLDLIVVGSVFILSLVPFFVTNALISGNPLVPPRMLQSANSAGVTADAVLGGGEGGSAGTGSEPAASDSGGGSGTGGSTSGSGQGTTTGESTPDRLAVVASLVAGMVSSTTAAFGVLLDQFTRAVEVLNAERLWHVFVRSGTIPGVDYGQTGGETIELTLLESAPLLAALVAAPVAFFRRFPAGFDRRDPKTGVDLLAVGFGLALTLLYLPRLPLHSTITVRYLAPMTPLAVYGVFRLPVVRRAVSAYPERFAGGLLAGTVGGLSFAAVALVGVTPGTGMQTHGVVNLAVAAVLGAWALTVSIRSEDEHVKHGATLLGIAVAAMVVLVLTSGLAYFAAERMFVLPYK